MAIELGGRYVTRKTRKSMKFKLRALSVVAALATCFAYHNAQAIPISGSIAFNGSATFDSTPISGATSFISLSPAFVAAFEQTGDYSAIPNFTSVAFTPFTFNSPTAPVVPLWTLTIGSVTYSFDATTMTSTYDAVHDVWDIGGSGVARIAGFDDTTGTWNLSAGSRFCFSCPRRYHDD